VCLSLPLEYRTIHYLDDRLPNLRSETTRLLGQCKEDLKQIPKPIGMEPAAFMLNLITALNDEVQQYVRGGTNTAQLIHENRAAFVTLKSAIRCTAPNFTPFVDATRHTIKFENSLGEGDGESPTEGLISTGKPFYLNDMRVHIEKFVDILIQELC
jgi:hypothetical protein